MRAYQTVVRDYPSTVFINNEAALIGIPLSVIWAELGAVALEKISTVATRAAALRYIRLITDDVNDMGSSFGNVHMAFQYRSSLQILVNEDERHPEFYYQGLTPLHELNRG